LGDRDLVHAFGSSVQSLVIRKKLVDVEKVTSACGRVSRSAHRTYRLPRQSAANFSQKGGTSISVASGNVLTTKRVWKLFGRRMGAEARHPCRISRPSN